MIYRALVLTLVFFTSPVLSENYRLNVFAETQNDTSVCKNDYRQCMLQIYTDSLLAVGNYRGVMLVAENNRVIFRRAYGRSVVDTSRQYAADTPMQLASVSKPFTAAAVLIAAEKGLLGLDDNLTDYFPKMRYKTVKIKHLLNHTSGIPDYLNQKWLFKKYIYRRKSFTNSDLVNYLQTNRPRPLFRAGARHKYCNTGYALLASVLEKVSGKSFGEFMQAEIFDPLEMSDTFLFSRDRGLRQLRPHDPLDDILGDKGVFSTVDDLYKWDRALEAEKVLPRQVLDSAYAPGHTAEGEKFDYGYGWRMVRKEFEEPIIYHRGLWQGANPMLIRYISCNRTIISLHDNNDVDGWHFIGSVRDILNESERFCMPAF